MMRLLYTALLATLALLATMIGSALAQENLPFGPENYEQDFQMFAPFTLDLDNMVDKQWSGYFFHYDRLFWAYSGERVTVGTQNASETIQWFNGINTQTITATNG